MPLRPAIESVEVLRERLPLPVDPGLHRLRGDVLRPLEVAEHEVLLVRPARREREAAVAHDHRGHAVPARARAERVPGDLRVHVGVPVDEARRYDEPARGDLLAPALVDAPDAGNAPTSHAHVGAEGGQSRAVDHLAATDHQVVCHRFPLRPRRARQGRGAGRRPLTTAPFQPSASRHAPPGAARGSRGASRRCTPCETRPAAGARARRAARSPRTRPARGSQR